MLTKTATYPNPSPATSSVPGAMADQEDQVLRYSPLVKTMAIRLQARLPDEISSDDLFTAGILGLMDAVGKYDASRGIPFTVYARTRIRGAMLDEIRALDWVPRGVRQKARRLEKVARTLECKLGRYPSDDEIAEALELSIEAYQDLLCEVRAISFVPEEVLMGTTDSGECDPQDEHPDTPFQTTYRQEIQAHLAAAITSLPRREQQVLGLYYQEELTMKEIGAVLGCTESRVCQIHSKIMLKLKSKLAQKLTREDLPGYLAPATKTPLGANGKRPVRTAAVALCEMESV